MTDTTGFTPNCTPAGTMYAPSGGEMTISTTPEAR